ncbi:unnamed protein product [Adineta steineri]|uniref:Tetraspanin n=1 Tax=Adineta steineri TaxID=433720 RepID=A0A818U8P0_9BILA|nr:unnamed protein product [Adineta steineri]
MVSSEVQSSVTSFSDRLDQLEAATESRRSNSLRSSSESDLIVNNSVINKLKSGVKWLIDPCQRLCSSKTINHQVYKYQFDSHCLKPEFNRVNGLLKYFTFGIMFTNSILGFIVFFIGLWSSFEHRKFSHMPKINTADSTSLNPFNFIGIILCIFGLLFFLLCIISCLGINRENLKLLRISLIAQFVTLIIFLTFAIIILIWGETIRNRISKTMMIGLKIHYHIDKAWTAFFDKLHMSYFCCGVYSFNDWNDNPNYACTSSNILQSLDACSVPFTCCKIQQKEVKNSKYIDTKSLSYTCGTNTLPSNNTMIDMNEIEERININGCFDEILPVIQQLIITASIFMLLICIIIFITILLTCLLTFEIRLTISNVRRHCRKKRHTDQNDYIEKEEETF